MLDNYDVDSEFAGVCLLFKDGSPLLALTSATKYLNEQPDWKCAPGTAVTTAARAHKRVAQVTPTMAIHREGARPEGQGRPGKR